MKHKNIIVIIFLFIVVGIFFRSLIFFEKSPIPTDALIGLYYPYRDIYAVTNPNGISYKNFLITDPVRQLYPWRELSISLLKTYNLPLWNPYLFTGTPLLANVQSASLYPLNIFLFFLPFSVGWNILIVLQTVFLLLFTYFYLRNLRLHVLASVFGAVVFGFCGFSISWLEWGTVVSSAMWLPLLLLSIDKVFTSVSKKQIIIWNIVILLSYVSAFFAGHIQIFFYLFLVVQFYFLSRVYLRRKKVFLLIYACTLFFVAVITALQWIPFLNYVPLSARYIDTVSWKTEGWFLPVQNLLQFVAPDFFGNPTTQNYWGIWNYGEFVGYIGIVPLLMASFALFYRRDKKTLFMGSVCFFSLLFALPTVIAKIPFQLHIPFLSTSQPTRLLFLIDFSLAVLSALGFDLFLQSKRRVLIPFLCISSIFSFLWIYVFLFHKFLFPMPDPQLSIVKSNLYFPTFIFFITAIFLLGSLSRKKIIGTVCISLLLAITVVDLLRFADKFIPFSDKKYLFPQEKVLSYLQQHTGIFRIMAMDSRILPPNVSMMYRLQTIEGYDPLYLKRYGQLIAYDQGDKNIYKKEMLFNRIITPHHLSHRLMNLLGVIHILSLSDITQEGISRVYRNGLTQIYKNTQAYPRAFFVLRTIKSFNEEDVLKQMFLESTDLRTTAFIEDDELNSSSFSVGKVSMESYTENGISIKTSNRNRGFLVLTDAYYPSWHVSIDGKETKMYITDYAFRGVIVPSGNHLIRYYVTLW